MSGVVCSSVCDRLYAESSSEQVRRRVDDPVEPRALEDLLEDDERRVKAVLVAATMMPLITKAKTTVTSGTMIPPARCLSARLPANVVDAGGAGLRGRTTGRDRSRGDCLLPAEHLEPDLGLAHLAGVLRRRSGPRR